MVTIIAAFTVTGGWVLWIGDLNDFGGFGDWVGSSFGLVLTIGGLAATAAFFAGLFGIPPNLKRLAELGGEVAAAGGLPTPSSRARCTRSRSGCGPSRGSTSA